MTKHRAPDGADPDERGGGEGRASRDESALHDERALRGSAESARVPARVPDPGSPSNRSFDRAELDRLIRRATELQLARLDERGQDRLSEAEVFRIGREVGLEPELMRRAMGEVRAESLLPPEPDERDLSTRLLGAARVTVSRVVPGRPAEVARNIEGYLRIGESLREVRKRAGRSRWEPQEGFMAQLQRGLRIGGRAYTLASASALQLTIEPLEEGTSLVALQADLSSARLEKGWGWVIGLTTGGAGAGLGIGFAVGFPYLALPVAVAGAAGGVMAGRKNFGGEWEKLRVNMEGILDRLERGERLLDPGPSWRERLLGG
jgi:hypothetical protein